MSNTKTVEAGERTRQLIGDTHYWVTSDGTVQEPCNFQPDGEGEKTFVRYIDMTPTWIGILPVLLETKNHPDSMSELEKMAKLADRLNTPLHKAASELLAEAIELLRNATYGDGLATVLTQDCEALEATIAKAEGKGN